MITINNFDEFNKAINEHELCMVKIGTNWCGPCKVIKKKYRRY